MVIFALSSSVCSKNLPKLSRITYIFIHPHMRKIYAKFNAIPMYSSQYSSNKREIYNHFMGKKGTFFRQKGYIFLNTLYIKKWKIDTKILMFFLDFLEKLPELILLYDCIARIYQVLTNFSVEGGSEGSDHPVQYRRWYLTNILYSIFESYAPPPIL